MTHTPGPWSKNQSRSPLYADTFWVEDSNGDVIAQTYARGTDGIIDRFHNGEENARLIAAAPEMLAALQAVLRRSEFGIDGKYIPSDEVEAIHTQARAAIAKARGD